MTTFTKATEFKAWQFKMTAEDLKLADWEQEAKQENDLAENIPNLSVRKFNLIDNSEADFNPRTPFASRFRVAIYEFDYNGIYGNHEGGYFTMNEGEWLIECGGREGYEVISDEKLREMILP